MERVVEPVEEMHRAIAKPWFRALGAVGRPVHILYDSASRVVYGSIRIGATALGAALDAGLSETGARTESFKAIVNGLWGDELGKYESRLATPMSVRSHDGAPIATGEIPDHFPLATGRIVVLVHGLMKTEQCWKGLHGRPGLGRYIEEDRSLTPVAVRYNTGRPVALSGEDLASVLDDVHSRWPVPVSSIALVGHSMGGLVIHRALDAATRSGHRWVEDVTDIVTIGSPHEGAPLEKLVHVGARALSIAPQTRPLAGFFERRSQGIKDLRFGTIGSSAPWAFSSPNVRHHFVAGVVTADPTHPVGAVVGDFMVRPSSGTRAQQLDPTNVVVLGGVHHFDLLHEPAVIETVLGWLAPAEDTSVVVP